MLEIEANYLVVTKTNTIDEKCSECGLAGVNLFFFPTLQECVRKIAEVSKTADMKVIGVYKTINKLTIDKDMNVTEG